MGYMRIEPMFGVCEIVSYVCNAGALLQIDALYANFNTMHLASNCKNKMATHGRNSTYYVFVLLDPFPRANDEVVGCPV